MNPEELKNIWSRQRSSDGVVTMTPELIWHLADGSARFKRTIFWRDVREWLATIFIAGFFFYAGLAHDDVHWAMIAAALIACVPMTYVALRGQKRHASNTTATLADHLRDSVASVQHQIELLRSVLWWYLAPLALSAALVFLDVWLSARVPPGEQLIFFSSLLPNILVTAAVFFAVWKINQRAVRKHLEPRLRQLEEALAELQS